MRRLALYVTLGLLVAFGTEAQANETNYPTRPITLIAPFAGGGASDILARAIAESLSKTLGQTVIVENHAGAGGTIGVGKAATANPDGYTLVLGGNGSIVFSEGFYELPYSVMKDLRPVGMVASASSALVVNTNLQVNSLDDLMKRSKQTPRLSYGSPGVGSALHLAGVLYSKLTDSQMVHVAYKGLVPALTDLQAGNISLVFANIANVRPFLESGKVKALAVVSKNRSPQLPDIPTTAELGLPDLLMVTWYGVMAPAKTDDAIIRKLNGALAKFVADPATLKMFETQGFDPASNTSTEEFQKTLEVDFAQWIPLIRQLGIKPQ